MWFGSDRASVHYHRAKTQLRIVDFMGVVYLVQQDFHRKLCHILNRLTHPRYNRSHISLNMPLNTVKTKIRRARAQLMKMMDTDDELL